jgi:hypothetical protein
LSRDRNLKSFLTLFFKADAFGGKSQAVSPLATPGGESEAETPVPDPMAVKLDEGTPGDDRGSEASHSALSAAKNRRVSGLVSQYLDKVTKESLPGDSVKLESKPSPYLKKLTYSPNPSSATARSNLEVETKELPDIGSIRARFEETSRSSGSNVFEFGESFRQKQWFSLQVQKEQQKEAVVSMRGFDEMMVTTGIRGSGEVDTSNLEKTYIFQGKSKENLALHDGSCKVDYENIDYRGQVFVVHRTRGKSAERCTKSRVGTCAAHTVHMLRDIFSWPLGTYQACSCCTKSMWQVDHLSATFQVGVSVKMNF